MWNDIRVGLRLLWKDKAFSITAVLTLALCIGANTALFSVVHNVLLKPLPIPESDRIVAIVNSYPGAGQAMLGSVGVPDYYDRLRGTTVFEEQALYNGRNQNVDENGAPTRVRVTQATPSLFRLLRVTPAIGRTFTEQDGEAGNDRKVVLSYAMWQSQFGGSPQAIGQDIRMDGQPFTVIGVMPQGFFFLNPNVMLWRPLAFTPEQKGDAQRHSNNYQSIARLKPGSSVRQAQIQIDAINAANLDRFPQYSFGVVAPLVSALGIYGVLAYLVTQRTKEIGIRIALGSSAAAIFELVLREGLVLIAAGFALGAAGALALRRSLESQLFGVSASDPAVLGGVTLVLALVAALACALPARRATRIDPIVALCE